MSELIFLAGLLLSQTLAFTEAEMRAVPTGVLDVYGQAHILSYRDQAPEQALNSVEAALMMHARDAARYGIATPGYLANSSQQIHSLQVSERGSADDLSIRFSLANQVADSTARPTFDLFEVRIRGKSLTAEQYTQLLGELRRGYRSGTSPQAAKLPELPLQPRAPYRTI